MFNTEPYLLLSVGEAVDPSSNAILQSWSLSSKQLRDLMSTECDTATWRSVLGAPGVNVNAKDKSGNFLLHQVSLGPQTPPVFC